MLGFIEDVFDILYYEINGGMVRDVVLRIKGLGGFFGVDVNGFRRIFICKFFKRLGIELCEVIVSMIKCLCMEYVDFWGLEVILVNWFIFFDKGEGVVWLIGVGEVLRRIMGKCVMNVIKLDVIDVSGFL